MENNKNTIDSQEIDYTSSDMNETEIESVPNTFITATDQEQDDYLYETFLERATQKIKIRRFILHKD